MHTRIGPSAEAEKEQAAMGYRTVDLADLDGVVAAASDDRSAMESLLAAILPLVVCYCRAELEAETEISGADAVANDVCRSIAAALVQRGHSDQPFPYLMWSMTFRRIEETRGTHRTADVAAVAETQPVSDSEADAPDSRMRQMLAVLPGRERTVLILRLICGLTPQETAIALGTTPGRVRVDQHRALGKLRKILTRVGCTYPDLLLGNGFHGE